MKINLNNIKDSKLTSGMNENDFSKIKASLLDAKEKFFKAELGFTELPYQYDVIKKDIEFIKEFSKEMDTIVVIGIGGSDLGTRAVHRALNHQYYNLKTSGVNKKIFFSGDTTDPQALAELLDVLDLSKTLFLVVSKSGNTIEQASTFVYFKEQVENYYKSIGESDSKLTKHFLFITDPETGTLKELSKKHGFKTIDIPQNVGGRFSVLSSVGIIPSSLIGINVEELLNGAKDLHEEIKNNEIDIVLEYVASKYHFWKIENKTISVLMPYQYNLFEFAKWYQQLWAESLGKKVNLEGKEVFEGQTPIAVLGPVDQHSQLQLFNEGPNDKFFTFIRAEESTRPVNLPENYENFEQFEFFKGKKFQEILNYEQETTAFALTKNNRPNCTISIPKVDAYNLGQLFYFFEVATAIFGYMLNINAFDQPGVELSKNAMYGVLGKSGYEEIKKDFKEYLK